MDSNYRYVARVNSELEGWDVIDTLEKTNAGGDCRDVPDDIWLMTIYDGAYVSRVIDMLNGVQQDKPKVLIKHGAADVAWEVSPPDSVDVTTRDVAEEDQLFLDHAGVQVYYALKDMHYGCEYEQCQYHVAPYSHYDVDNTGVADIRDFPEPPDEYFEKYPDDDTPEKTALRWMIDTEQWPPDE